MKSTELLLLFTLLLATVNAHATIKYEESPAPETIRRLFVENDAYKPLNRAVNNQLLVRWARIIKSCKHDVLTPKIRNSKTRK